MRAVPLILDPVAKSISNKLRKARDSGSVDDVDFNKKEIALIKRMLIQRACQEAGVEPSTRH